MVPGRGPPSMWSQFFYHFNVIGAASTGVARNRMRSRFMRKDSIQAVAGCKANPHFSRTVWCDEIP